MMKHNLKACAAIAALGLTGCVTATNEVVPISGDPVETETVTAVEEATEPAFSFAIIADVPYSKADETMLKTAVPKINEKGPAFVLHLGDFIAGADACSDEIDDAFIKLINKIQAPFFYTPGDNEWTDCDYNPSGGATVDELTRLNKIRTKIFGHMVMKNTASWQTQVQVAINKGRDPNEALAENFEWSQPGVRFSTISVAGTNYGRDYVSDSDAAPRAAMIAELDRMEAANALWITRQFAEAKANAQDILVIAMQANPNNPKRNFGPDRISCAEFESNGRELACDGYMELRQQLVREAKAFPGKVLILHGDTYEYGFAKDPLLEPHKNVWRFDAAGDVKCNDDGVEEGVRDVVWFTITPGDADPFSYERLTNDASPICPRP